MGCHGISMEYLRIIWNIMDYLRNVMEYPGHVIEYLWNILDYLRNIVEYHGPPKEYHGFIYGMSYNILNHVMEYLRNIMEYLSMGYNGIFCTPLRLWSRARNGPTQGIEAN